MKRLYILLLFAFSYACNCKEKTRKISVPVIDATKDKGMINYTYTFNQAALKASNIKSFIDTILQNDERIFLITLDKKIGNLKYSVTEDKVYPYKDFYSLSKTIEFDWTYYLYNDIYKASFHFPEVKSVSVYDKTNKIYITYLPAKYDMLLSIENDILPRSLYVPDLDYNTLQIDCAAFEKSKCVIEIDSLSRQISIKMKH